MTSEQIDRVFGRGRLQMVTGAHVEVFREAAAPGESRRYTKRFLTTADGDYAQWTEREWRILARLIGHGTRCVPDVVQYDRDARGTKLVQTYDAGATVDQWATLLPVERDGRVYAHAFEDCAHWWALAHHCLVALDEIHTLQLVHLDVKGDNICIPIGPASFDPANPGERMFPVFRKLALIDFAFSLVSGETLTTPLPIGWQQDYDYQSPRLLHALEAGRAGDLQPTEDLDWRCDMYSLAAMLKRYLPAEDRLYQAEAACGWNTERYGAAKSLILRIREAHDRDPCSRRPHAELIAQTSGELGANALAQSLERGWMLARDAQPFAVPALPLTPVTRLAPPIRLVVPPRDDLVPISFRTDAAEHRSAVSPPATRRSKLPLLAAAASVATAVGIVPFFVDAGTVLGHATQFVVDGSRTMGTALRGLVGRDATDDTSVSKRPNVEPPVMQPSMTTAATEPVDEVDGAGAAPSAGEPANDAGGPASTPLSDASVAATKETTLPVQSESTRTSPPAESPQSSSQSAQRFRSPSAASSPSSLIGESLADQIEAHRFKPVPRSTPSVRAPSSSATARAPSARPADSARRTQVARTNKVLRPAAPAGASASRAQPTLASKRTGGASIVASSQMQARTPPTPVPSRATSASPPSVVQPVASMVEAKAAVALPPKDATTVAGLVTQDAAAPASAAQTVTVVNGPTQAMPDALSATPSSTSAAVTFPIAPPIETPRAMPAPNTGGTPTAMAPIVEASRTFVAPAIPVPREPPPLPDVETPRSRPAPAEMRDDSKHLEQARRTLASVVPRTSAQAHAQVARVMWFAANAHHPAQERAVIEAAASAGVPGESAFLAREVAPGEARRLHEEARHAYWSRRHVPEAFDLQLKAFGANPNDPEIAGHLAFLYLKLLPAQPERARQLALHAIGMRSARYPTGRLEDWTTFAIASALTGRQMDARHALYTSLALTRNLDRSCRTALAALATYGERLREPVEALLYRLHAQGRADDSPYCTWSAGRIAGSRYP